MNYAAICKIPTEEGKNPPIKNEIEGADGTYFVYFSIQNFAESLVICQDGFSFFRREIEKKGYCYLQTNKKGFYFFFISLFVLQICLVI